MVELVAVSPHAHTHSSRLVSPSMQPQEAIRHPPSHTRPTQHANICDRACHSFAHDNDAGMRGSEMRRRAPALWFQWNTRIGRLARTRSGATALHKASPDSELPRFPSSQQENTTSPLNIRGSPPPGAKKQTSKTPDTRPAQNHHNAHTHSLHTTGAARPSKAEKIRSPHAH